VLAWNGLVFLCVRSRLLGERGIMALGVAGNVVVSLCWFGPAALAGTDSYGAATPMVWYLSAFALIQVPLMGLAFLPAGRLRRQRASFCSAEDQPGYRPIVTFAAADFKPTLLTAMTRYSWLAPCCAVLSTKRISGSGRSGVSW
jgi:hypothetical protein